MTLMFQSTWKISVRLTELPNEDPNLELLKKLELLSEKL